MHYRKKKNYTTWQFFRTRVYRKKKLHDPTIFCYTQVEGALSAIEESVQANPTLLEGKEASTEQSVESPEARTQPSMATPTEEDTRPKVLIRGEWRKVPDGYPADASGQLERDQLFVNDLSKHLVAELRAACQFNPNPDAKPKSSDTKTDLIYKHAFCNYL